MRIAQISTMATPVGPRGAGSIESIVWTLTRKLVRLGHRVVVFAAGGSETDGQDVHTLSGPYGADGAPHDWQLCEWINLTRALSRAEEFIVLHSHAYLWGVSLERLTSTPLVHSLHAMPGYDERILLRSHPWSTVVAISEYQARSLQPERRDVRVVQPGLDSSQFTFSPHPGDYFAFLGRILPQKGILLAIRAARSLDVPLLHRRSTERLPQGGHTQRYREPMKKPPRVPLSAQSPWLNRAEKPPNSGGEMSEDAYEPPPTLRHYSSRNCRATLLFAI